MKLAATTCLIELRSCTWSSDVIVQPPLVLHRLFSSGETG